MAEAVGGDIEEEQWVKFGLSDFPSQEIETYLNMLEVNALRGYSSLEDMIVRRPSTGMKLLWHKHSGMTDSRTSEKPWVHLEHWLPCVFAACPRITGIDMSIMTLRTRV